MGMRMRRVFRFHVRDMPPHMVVSDDMAGAVKVLGRVMPGVEPFLVEDLGPDLSSGFPQEVWDHLHPDEPSGGPKSKARESQDEVQEYHEYIEGRGSVCFDKPKKGVGDLETGEVQELVDQACGPDLTYGELVDQACKTDLTYGKQGEPHLQTSPFPPDLRAKPVEGEE